MSEVKDSKEEDDECERMDTGRAEDENGEKGNKRRKDEDSNREEEMEVET